MAEISTAYGFGTRVRLSFEDAVARVKAELGKEGFGVLSEIDVAATLKQKLGVDMPRYVILGACNPPLAYQAIGAEPEIGLLLPCNVVVREEGEGSVVSALDPEAALGLASNASLRPLALEVKTRIERVVEAVAGGSAD